VALLFVVALAATEPTGAAAEESQGVYSFRWLAATQVSLWVEKQLIGAGTLL